MQKRSTTWLLILLALFFGSFGNLACQGTRLDQQPAGQDPATTPLAADNSTGSAMNEPTDDSPAWPLSCDIEMPEVVPLGEKIELVFVLHHHGTRPLWVLPWQTPIEGLIASPFAIMKGEKPILFTGRMVKRGSPRLGEYVEIPPQTTRRYPVDLATAYAFEGPGRYSVTFDSLLFDVTADSTVIPRTLDLLQSFELDCPTVQFEIR